MMHYICNHYVHKPDGMYAPGTELDVSDLTQSELERLLRNGAVRAEEIADVLEHIETAPEAVTETAQTVEPAEITEEEADNEIGIAAEDMIVSKPKKRAKKQ